MSGRKTGKAQVRVKPGKPAAPLVERVIAAMERLVGKGNVTRGVHRGDAQTWMRVSDYTLPADFADDALRGWNHHYQISVFSESLDPEERFAAGVDAAMLGLGFMPGLRRLEPDPETPDTLHYMTQWTIYEEV